MADQLTRAGSNYNRSLEINLSKDGPFTKYKISRYVSEFSGTFILVAAIKLLFGSNYEENLNVEVLAPIGVGFTLMMVVYNYGYNSLGMYNPSVTIAHIIRDSQMFKRSDYMQWIIYFIAQFAGGICGGFFGAIIGGKEACMVYTRVVYPKYKVHQAFLGEFFFCSILVSLNIHLATDKRIDGNQFYGIAIGTCLFISILAIGPITGSAINPAVWSGTVASAAFCDINAVNIDNCWIYWVAHISAGLFGGIWFRIVYGCDESYGVSGKNKKMVGSQSPHANTVYTDEDRDESDNGYENDEITQLTPVNSRK
eukprot:470614_1